MNNDEIKSQTLKMDSLKKRLATEYDVNEQRKLRLQIKVCELKIMIAGIQ